MKILIVHNKYLSRTVGGEDVVYENEIAALREALGQANVFTYSVCNDAVSKFSLIFSLLWSWKHYHGISHLVKKNAIDIVHVHNFFPLLTPSVFAAAKRAGAHTVQTLHNFRWNCLAGIFYREPGGICEICARKAFNMHGAFHRCYRGSLVQSFAAALAFWWYKKQRYQNYIDTFFVLTKFQKQKMLQVGYEQKKIQMKPNFVDVPHAVNTPMGKKDFLFIGRLEYSKGVLPLIRAWEKIETTFRLYIIGTGPLEGKIRALNLPHVILLGSRPHPETFGIIRRSQYLIQSSLWFETFGLTIIEAMALGTPVIGFDIGTRPELITHGVNGFLTTPENLPHTIRAAKYYEKYEDLCANSMQFAQRFSKRHIIAQQVELYRKLLADE